MRPHLGTVAEVDSDKSLDKSSLAGGPSTYFGIASLLSGHSKIFDETWAVCEISLDKQSLKR
jgi:hypothetical protein